MSKRYTILLSIISALFLILGIMLCYYSRLATDDYYFIADVRAVGINQSVYSQYMAWCGRFAACYLVDFFYKAFDTDQTWYFIFPLGSFFLLIAGIYQLLGVLSYRLSFWLESTHQWIYSIIFTCLLFFLSVDIGETWIWYCSLSSYLWSVIAFVWGLVFLFGNYKTIVSILLSSLCFIYVGGASEVYSVIYGVLMLVYMIYHYKAIKNKENVFLQNLLPRLIPVYLVFGISFLVFLMAPGNYLRDELFPKHEILNTFFIAAKSIVKFGILYLPVRLAYILAFASPFIILGEYISREHSGWHTPFRKFFIKATLLLLSLSLLFFLLVAYVMVETGPPRIWFILSFLLAVYFSSICFYAGYTNFINEQKAKILSTAGIVLAFIVLGYNIINQFGIVRTYAKASDERVDYLRTLKETIQHDTLIELKPLPYSGMLYSAEIQADTNHFTNKELKMGYDLKFHVVVKE